MEKNPKFIEEELTKWRLVNMTSSLRELKDVILKMGPVYGSSYDKIYHPDQLIFRIDQLDEDPYGQMITRQYGIRQQALFLKKLEQ